MADEKIKILQLIDTFYPTVDGAINVVKYYSENLNKIAECKLATPSASKKDNYDDLESFEVIRCLSSGAPENYRSGYPALDFKFAKKIAQEKFDIYHTHSPFGLGRFAVRTAKKMGVPVVATLHTQYHKDFERVLKNNGLVDFMIGYIMQVYDNADSVWTVSNRSCQILRDYGYKGKIEVIRNGTDMKYPENADQLIDKINQTHNLYEQENVFLFVGRMVWYKNLKIIVDSLSLIKKSGKKFKMLFVGGGFDIDEVKAYVQEKNLSSDCIFTGSVSDKNLLQGYYLRADLLLFPSVFDMAPVTAVEAAAHYLPALMVDGSCSAELVEDGANGFLAEENAESFSEKILEIMGNPARLKEVGDNAHKTLYRSWEMVAEEVYEKYKKVIKDYNRRKKAKERLKQIKKAKKNI